MNTARLAKRMLGLIVLAVILFGCAGSIVDVRGPCGGDGLENKCRMHPGCCPNGTHCTATSCEINRPGPRYLPSL